VAKSIADLDGDDGPLSRRRIVEAMVLRQGGIELGAAAS
jgi:hypothetical protein